MTIDLPAMPPATARAAYKLAYRIIRACYGDPHLRDVLLNTYCGAHLLAVYAAFNTWAGNVYTR